MVESTLFLGGAELPPVCLHERFWVAFTSRMLISGNRLVQTTTSIDLSTSWTNSTVSANSIDRPSDMKTSRRPLLWYNAENHNVYEWGGWTYDGNTGQNEDLTWTFSPDGRGGAVWTPFPAPTVEGNPLTASFGASTVTASTGFYALGGTLIPPVINGSELPPNISMQGLVSTDFSTNTWANASSADFFPSGYSDLGDACFVPNFGQEGLLVFLGGDTPPNETYQYQAEAALADMATIPIYDIHGGNWYNQTATGDVPSGRTGFCAIGAPAGDNSSFEM